MIYLIDTNICIVYLRNRPSPVQRKIQQSRTQDIALCAIVVAELYEGAYRSARQAENLEKVVDFIQPFHVLPFDTVAAELAGRYGADLSAKGTPIGPHDLQIAAIALANSLVMVTHNTREFSRIAGLRLEDWERDDTIATP